MSRFNIIFRGEVIQGKNAQKLAIALARLLNLPVEKAPLLLSGKSYYIRKNLTARDASSVHSKLLSAGLITYIKEVPSEIHLSLEPEQPSAPQPSRLATETTQHRTAPPHSSGTSDYSGLSKKWQKIFTTFDEIGADKGYFKALRSQEMKARPRKEYFYLIMRLQSNLWAFLFGWVYYITKGMVKKGLYLLLLASILSFLLLVGLFLIAGTDTNGRLLIFSFGAIYSTVANYDYYRYYKFKETFWPWLPQWLGHWWCILLFYIFIMGPITYLSFFTVEFDDISSVKGAYLDDYAQTTVGLAFDNWYPCKQVDWQLQQSANGTQTVIYQCQMKLKAFKDATRTAVRLMTGEDKSNPLPDLKSASLQVTFTLNRDDTFEVKEAQWDFDGREERYQPYITNENAIDDIYNNRLSLTVQEVLTPQNAMLNQEIKRRRGLGN